MLNLLETFMTTRRTVAAWIIVASSLLAGSLVAAQEPIKIGFFGPLSGPAAALGVDAKRGADLAVKQINAAGGIDGRPVQLISYDDRGNRAEAVSVMRKLVESDRVTAILSGSLSLTNIAAGPVADQTKTPMVVSYANAVGVVKGNEYVYRWTSLADVHGWVMAHDAFKRGFKTFALIVQDEEYGRGVANGAEKAIEKLGGAVVFKRTYAPVEREFRAMMTEVRNLAPEATIVSGFSGGVTAVARQGWEIGAFPSSQFYGGHALNETDWYRGIGDLGDGAMGAFEILIPTPGESAQRFHQEWIDEFNDPIVTNQAVMTYDAARYLFDAIKRGGVDREGIRQTLLDTKNFTNVSGYNVSITDIREPLVPFVIARWDSKARDLVFMDVIQDAEMLAPEPWYQYYQ